MGEILIEQGKLKSQDIQRILTYQQNEGLYFGEAAIALKLANQDDVLRALSMQFGYTYSLGRDSISTDLVMAHVPFSKQAEEFRAIRSRLINNWLSLEKRTMAVVSPASREGRSYIAANLALAFAQSGHSTLLIDADMRAPHQHELFGFKRRIGFSMLLAGRIKRYDLDALPDQIATFQNLSVMGCGVLPPNPAELLCNGVFPLILQELKKYFDVILFDTPPAATYQADVTPLAAAVDSTLLVTRAGHSKIADVKLLMSLLEQAKSSVVGSVLNQY
jgi:receptor protein-tyrosine kinase